MRIKHVGRGSVLRNTQTGQTVKLRRDVTLPAWADETVTLGGTRWVIVEYVAPRNVVTHS